MLVPAANPIPIAFPTDFCSGLDSQVTCSPVLDFMYFSLPSLDFSLSLSLSRSFFSLHLMNSSSKESPKNYFFDQVKKE